jgi:hypothetical protein
VCGNDGALDVVITHTNRDTISKHIVPAPLSTILGLLMSHAAINRTAGFADNNNII